jgi:phytoene/squalene synthetase
MTEIAGRARAALEEGAGLLPLIDRDARVCPALLRDLYEGVLRRIEASGFDVFGRRHALGTPA